MKKINSKSKALEGSKQISYYKSMGIFSRHSRVANSKVKGLIWPNFKPIRDFIVVLVTCKNEEDPIKNKGARVVTTVSINFKDAEGQLTPSKAMRS